MTTLKCFCVCFQKHLIAKFGKAIVIIPPCLFGLSYNFSLHYHLPASLPRTLCLIQHTDYMLLILMSLSHSPYCRVCGIKPKIPYSKLALKEELIISAGIFFSYDISQMFVNVPSNNNILTTASSLLQVHHCSCFWL